MDHDDETAQQTSARLRSSIEYKEKLGFGHVPSTEKETVELIEQSFHDGWFAHKKNEFVAEWRPDWQRRLLMILWGSILLSIAVFVAYVIWQAYVHCEVKSVPVQDETGTLKDAPVQYVTCTDKKAWILYQIMKDWGAALGVVGAGAGLAWSNFYNKGKRG